MPLVSKLSQRDRDAGIEDFQSCLFLSYLTGYPSVDRKRLGLWNDTIPFLPQDVGGMFQEIIQAGFRVQVYIGFSGNIEMKFHKQGGISFLNVSF